MTFNKETATFTFTKEELEAHDKAIKEKAYRKAAICTVNKLLPIVKYGAYLTEEYGLGKK